MASGRLTRAVRSELERGLELPVTDDAHERAVDEAFRAVNWVEPDVLPLPADLPRAWRELMDCFGARDLRLAAYGVPSSGALRRRWLDGEPRGVLEEKVTCSIGGAKYAGPLWRALALLEKADADDEKAALLAELAIGERVRGHAEIHSDAPAGKTAYGLPPLVLIDWFDVGLLDRIDDSGATWLPAAADGFVRRAAERGKRMLNEVCFPIFLALVRANIPIEPRWEALLPLGTGKHAELAAECAGAIPTRRRTRAIVSALRGTTSAVSAGLPLLEKFPSEELTLAIVDGIGDSGESKKVVLAKLDAIGAKRPAVRQALRGWKKGRPAPIVLRCAKVTRPDGSTKLDDVRARQIEVAGEASDKRRLTAAKRMVTDGFRGILEICELRDAKGQPAFDVLLHGSDDGTIFRAATTEIFAHIVQGGVDLADERLRESLDDAIATRPR